MKNRKTANLVSVLIMLAMVLFSLAPTIRPVVAAQPAVATTPINKVAVVYGYSWTEADTAYAAKNFNLLIVDFEGQESAYPVGQYMQSIKSKNPVVEILGYKDLIGMHTVYEDWAEVNAHEDWFVHDVDGNRLKNNMWGWYLMDVGNAGWRQHFVDYVNQKLVAYTAYSGVYCDDVWDELHNPTNPAFDHVPVDSVVSRWHSDTLGMLQYVKANLPQGKLLVINTEAGWMWGHTNFDYLNAVDGMEIEGYFHGPGEDSSSYSRIAESQITCLTSGSSDGKIMIAESGSTTEDSRILKWTYATFLLGINSSNTYWGWNIGNFYTLHNSYQSIMDTNIGSPVGAYYKSQNVYMRDFTGGKVISNLNAESQFINLDGTYWSLDNTAVSALILDGYSAEVLLNAPLPPPSPSPTTSPSPIPSPSPTLTPYKSPTPTPTHSPSLSPSVSPSPTLTPYRSPGPTLSPIPSVTPTPTIAPGKSPSPSNTQPATSKQISGIQATLIGVSGVGVLVLVLGIAMRWKKFHWTLNGSVKKLRKKIKKHT